ncbi:hypothetical protein [Streptomyces griseus]|uniref:hypothetical protein n=1 Tax=Streptomyces griseus TaxID=1911 RepID=UPI0036D002A1
MTPLEELLSQARLVRDRVVPPDIIPTTPHPHPGPGPAPAPGQAAPPQDPRHVDEAPTHPAARDLRALCATLVTHTPATTVTHFLTDQLPEPRSALILACVLQLTDTEDAARFWWQYAAGAGQSAAAYCLHLHHLARGEEDTARFWHDQMDHTPHPAPAPAPDHGERLDTASTTTMLRVLHHLARQTPPRPSSATVTSLMDYMPTATAVGYLREPDMELPLPGPDFARTIRTLLTAAPRPADPLDTRTRPRRRPNRPAAAPGRETPPAEAKEHALGQRGPGTRH